MSFNEDKHNNNKYHINKNRSPYTNHQTINPLKFCYCAKPCMSCKEITCLQHVCCKSFMIICSECYLKGVCCNLIHSGKEGGKRIDVFE